VRKGTSEIGQLRTFAFAFMLKFECQLRPRQQTAGIKIKQVASPRVGCASMTGKICETGLLEDSDVERHGTQAADGRSKAQPYERYRPDCRNHSERRLARPCPAPSVEICMLKPYEWTNRKPFAA
jgi:hypothetical protein